MSLRPVRSLVLLHSMFVVGVYKRAREGTGVPSLMCQVSVFVRVELDQVPQRSPLYGVCLLPFIVQGRKVHTWGWERGEARGSGASRPLSIRTMGPVDLVDDGWVMSSPIPATMLVVEGWGDRFVLLLTLSVAGHGEPSRPDMVLVITFPVDDVRRSGWATFPFDDIRLSGWAMFPRGRSGLTHRPLRSVCESDKVTSPSLRGHVR